MIDALIWTSWMMAVIFIPWPDSVPGKIRFAICALPPLVAEPVSLHFYRASMGQSLLGLRVEARPGRPFPGLPLLVVRHLSKFFLGGLSLTFVPFAPRGEAVHDRLFKTVVVRSSHPQPVDPIRPEQGSVRRLLVMLLWIFAGIVLWSIFLGIALAIFFPGYLDASDGEKRAVDSILLIPFGLLEA